MATPQATSDHRANPTWAPAHVQRNVGRLLEVRCPNLRDSTLAQSIDDDIGQLVRGLHEPLLFCVDWRNIGILPPETADKLIRLMRDGNPRVLRAATLVDGGRAAFTLQVQRVFKEARGTMRQVFQDPEELLGWLSDVATEQETLQARRFLGWL
jgi:hypothetical protein